MKALKAGLLDSVTGTYDPDQTFITGRVLQKVVAGKDVVGAPLVTFADVFTGFSVAPGHCVINPATGRKFELQNVTTNNPVVLAFTFDIVSGEWVYIGRITLRLPVGTHSYRGFDFNDTNVNNIRILVSSTVTTAICQGGTYYTWNLALTDFTLAGTDIYMATGANQKAVYFGQYAGQVGLLHMGTSSSGVCHGANLNTLAYKNRAYQLNGSAALPQIYGWDFSLGNPSVDGTVADGMTSQTTPFAGTSPSAYFRLGAVNPGYSTTANTTSQFEAVILQAATTPIPSNFVATPNNTNQTLYYMRDLQLVSGVWYCNLSTTSTGAAVVPAQNQASFTMMRGNGISTTHSHLKTGNLSPGQGGTLISSNCFGTTIPTNAPAAPALNGEDCFFFATSAALYLLKVSDITDGGTTWSNLTGVNLFGTTLDITAPSVLLAQYSQVLDRWVYVTNTSKFVVKPHQNNLITANIGSLSNLYLELSNYPSVPLGMAAIVTLTSGSGWIFITGSTTGQRGVIACDLRSDILFDYSYIVSKVLEVPAGSVIRTIATDEAAADFTGDCAFFIRSANTANDAIFSSPTGGWVEFFPYEDNAPQVIGPFFQVKIGFVLLVDSKNISPAQLHDIFISYDEPGGIDNKFQWDVENTSKAAESPMVVSVRQVREIPVVPNEGFLLQGRDSDGNVQVTVDSSLPSPSILLSADGGATFNAWISITDFMTNYNSDSGDTVIKFVITTPPSDVTVPSLTWSFTYA